MQALLRRILRVNPLERPSPQHAANVACISLFNLAANDAKSPRTQSGALLDGVRARVAEVCRFFKQVCLRLQITYQTVFILFRLMST